MCFGDTSCERLACLFGSALVRRHNRVVGLGLWDHVFGDGPLLLSDLSRLGVDSLILHVSAATMRQSALRFCGDFIREYEQDAPRGVARPVPY